MLVARDLWVGPPGGECPPALRGFSISVGRGEWVVVTGPNGSGKSTLALALAGLLPPRRGSVEFEGAPLAPGGASRHRIAAVLQEMSSQLLQPTVAEELGFTARNLGRAESEVRAGIEAWSRRLALQHDLDREPRSLSAGRQQLVLIAAALIAGPDVLIADEAGAHLDRDARMVLLEVLRAETRRGLSVVWVTQEPAERAAADRTVVLGDPGGESEDPVPGPGAGASLPSPAPRTLLELIVSPRDGLPGPGVSTTGPFRIEIEERGVVALEGRNGSGKTILLECACGLRRLSQVRAVWRRAPRQPPILAAQSPELQLFEERVGDEATYAAVSRGLGREQAWSMAAGGLEAMGLGGRGFLERRCWDLSAGEKRLVHVVGALITPASLVLLDEPTCGLDGNRRLALARLIEIRSRRDPVMVATQDSAWAEAVGARRFLMRAEVAATWQVPAKKTD